MFNKNLKFFCLKKGLTKKALADLAGVTPMAITYYEQGERRPDMNVMKRLAKALDVRISDFLTAHYDSLQFSHEEFRKNSTLTKTTQDFIFEYIEEYLNRFFTTCAILGGELLPDPPAT